MTIATITYKDGTKGTFTSHRNPLLRNQTFIQILQIQSKEIKKIEIESDKGELELL